MKKNSFLTMILVCSAVLGCGKKSTSTSSPSTPAGTGTGTTGLPTDLLKTIVRCDHLDASAGTVMATHTNSSSMTFAANGTYTMYTVYTEGTGCVLNKFSSGSEDGFDFGQAGTFTLDATLNDGSYQVTLTPTSQYLVGRSGTTGAPMMAAVNGNCTPGPGLTANHQVAVLGITCGSSFNSQYVIPSTPLIGTAIKQLIKVNGTTWDMGARDDILHVGQVGGYPSSTSQTWDVYP